MASPNCAIIGSGNLLVACSRQRHYLSRSWLSMGTLNNQSYNDFHSRKCNLNLRLHTGGHLVYASICWLVNAANKRQVTIWINENLSLMNTFSRIISKISLEAQICFVSFKTILDTMSHQFQRCKHDDGQVWTHLFFERQFHSSARVW